MDEIKYPIGAFELPKEITQKHITTYIEELDNSTDSASLSRCGYE